MVGIVLFSLSVVPFLLPNMLMMCMTKKVWLWADLTRLTGLILNDQTAIQLILGEDFLWKGFCLSKQLVGKQLIWKWCLTVDFETYNSAKKCQIQKLCSYFPSGCYLPVWVNSVLISPIPGKFLTVSCIRNFLLRPFLFNGVFNGIFNRLCVVLISIIWFVLFFMLKVL